ncbi:MAG TPA: universal stress protein [Candidatus Angelobacter sp.]|nr:universal stress protein [Candidatus Angelobacter sp.]
MPYKVLVAIDSTGLSELVMDALNAQMNPAQTEVQVVQVVDPGLYAVPTEMNPGYQPEDAVRRNELREEAKLTLGQAEERIRKAGFNVSSQVVEADPEEGILEAAANWNANMIIVTSHARKRMARFFHHSVAQSIVHRAPCSVLVLKELEGKAAA